MFPQSEEWIKIYYLSGVIMHIHNINWQIVDIINVKLKKIAGISSGQK